MTQKIKGSVYLAGDLYWRAMLYFPNWFSVVLPKRYANEQTARQGVASFAARFGLKIKSVDINYLKHQRWRRKLTP